MFKTFIAAVLATLAFIVPAHASTLEEVVDNTYRLYSNDRKTCSIQSVNIMGNPLDNVFLTAQHCVQSGDDFSIFLPVYNDELELISKTYRYLDEVYNGELMSKGEDVATLELRPPTPSNSDWASGVDIATEEQINNLKIGDTLTTVGYPSTGWSDDLYISTGIFLGFTESPGAKVPGKWIKTSIPVDGGSSGGGLYLKDGDEYYLISVTSQKDPATTAPMSYYTDPEFIRNALSPQPTREETAKAISDALKGISEILN